jgi:hypothetical protein
LKPESSLLDFLQDSIIGATIVVIATIPKTGKAFLAASLKKFLRL